VIQVSGAASREGSGRRKQIKNEIQFVAARLTNDSDWVRAGVLEYRAVLLERKLERLNDRPYFDMGSLKVRLDVRYAK
jgi:hypothetical protein